LCVLKIWVTLDIIIEHTTIWTSTIPCGTLMARKQCGQWFKLLWMLVLVGGTRLIIITKVWENIELMIHFKEELVIQSSNCYNHHYKVSIVKIWMTTSSINFLLYLLPWQIVLWSKILKILNLFNSNCNF
jgi:hypothetical protein